jgi:mercuric ion transport protein
MNSTVELIYDEDCPNVAAARTQLLRAFAQAGLMPRWQEWERSAKTSPDYVRTYGSPTVLVNGCDVTTVEPAAGSHCRIYRDQEGRWRGMPNVEDIAGALNDTQRSGGAASSWRNLAATAPAIGFALLPKLTCPACWPAYAGLFSALGLGFIDYTPYLLPLTALFLAVTLGALGYRAKLRRGYRPLWLGVAASLIVIAGKFIFDSDPALYSGVVLLVAASLWNSWPAKAVKPCCNP